MIIFFVMCRTNIRRHSTIG